MSKKSHSRIVRQLAEDLINQMAGNGDMPEPGRSDLVTSLVRQWISYDGNAALFLGDRHVYFVLDRTPLGKLRVTSTPTQPGWVNLLIEDWKIRPEELPEIFEQLNRGQSAEATNSEGVPLRLWVNPKQRREGVERLINKPAGPGRKRDYHKIARSEVGRRFHESVDADEREELACSVARQWQKYQGHASIFVGREQMVFTLTEQADGGCLVETRKIRTEIEPLLHSLGFAPEVIPEVLARINLDQEVAFQDKNGIPSRLWHDPKARQIRIQTLRPG